MADIVELARSVPGWGGLDLVVQPIDTGITNRNYLVDVAGGRYVVRVPGERTEVLGIDRACEAEAARRAADLGIGPPVHSELPGYGTLITAFLEGRVAEPGDFASPARLAALVEALRAFHMSGSLRGSFPIHRVVEWHARDAVAHGGRVPQLYERLHGRSAAIEAAFAHHPTAPVPCHNDLLPANVLLDGDRVWLLDFEYAGMNDALFDLGNLSVNCAFTPEFDEQLLASYFGEVTPARWARLQLMKVMSELREGMWAVVQQAISTLTNIDFVAYADERLESCRRLVETADFERWLVDASEPV